MMVALNEKGVQIETEGVRCCCCWHTCERNGNVAHPWSVAYLKFPLKQSTLQSNLSKYFCMFKKRREHCQISCIPFLVSSSSLLSSCQLFFAFGSYRAADSCIIGQHINLDKERGDMAVWGTTPASASASASVSLYEIDGSRPSSLS